MHWLKRLPGTFHQRRVFLLTLVLVNVIVAELRLSMGGPPAIAERPRAAAASTPLTSPNGDRGGGPTDEMLALMVDGRRDERQQPDRVIECLGLQEGQTVGDIGAGSGYFTFRLSRVVGSSGKVYAVDTSRRAVNFLNRRLRTTESSVTNVEVVRSSFSDCLLPENSLDVALMVDVHFIIPPPANLAATSDRREEIECLRSVYRALKPEGRLAVIESRENKSLGEVDVERLSTWFLMLGFKVERVYDFLSSQHFVVFTKR